MKEVFPQAVCGLMFVFAMTSLGSAAACFLGDRAIKNGISVISGLSAGIMFASSVWSLILPALSYGNAYTVSVGFLAGIVGGMGMGGGTLLVPLLSFLDIPQ